LELNKAEVYSTVADPRIGLFFEELVPFLSGLLDTQQQNLIKLGWASESTEILLVTCKIFSVAISTSLLDCLNNQQQLESWISLVNTILKLELPANLASPTSSWDESYAREREPPIKLKRIALQIASSFAGHWRRYEVNESLKRTKGNSYHQEPSVRGEKAAQEFGSKYYFGLLDIALTSMQSSFTTFVSPRTLVFCVKYIINCFQVNSCLDTVLKNPAHMNTIMMEMCLPLLCQTEYDHHLREIDTKEFMYSVTYKTEDHNMVKNAAAELLQKICEIEVDKKKQFLHQYIGSINQRLLALKDKNDKSSIIQKECLLHGIEVVVDQFVTDREIRNSLTNLLSGHLLPILEADKHSFGILAFRICSLYSRIGYFIKYNGPTHIEFCKLVCQAIDKGPDPTKIKAAEALSVLVQNQYELKEMISGELDFILKKLLEMIEQFDFDGLVDTLKTIINSFQFEIGPHSAKVFEGLKTAFYNYKSDLNSYRGVEEREAECAQAEIAAETCMTAMNNLIQSNLLPQVYESIAKSVLEMLHLCILEDDEANFPTCMSMLNIVISKAPRLTNELIAYYPILCYFVIGNPRHQGSAYLHDPKDLGDEQFEAVVAKMNRKQDVLEDIHLISTCLQNFTIKLGDSINTMTDFFGKSFLDRYYQAMDGIGAVCKEGDLSDLVWALKMGMALLENLTTEALRAGNHIEMVFQMTDQILNTHDIPHRVISTGIAVFSIAFLRDLPTTMQVLQKKFPHRNYIEKWFFEIGKCKTASQTNKTYFLRALQSFLDADRKSLPEGLDLRQVLAAFINLAEDFIEYKLDQADPDYEASEEESDEFEMIYDDEDDEWDEDEDYEPEEQCYYYSRILQGCPIIERFGADGTPNMVSISGLFQSSEQKAALESVIQKARHCLRLNEDQEALARQAASGIKAFN
jgi:hypothetical protein